MPETIDTTTTIRCPMCERDGIEVTTERTIATHNRESPCRMVCGASGMTLVEALVDSGREREIERVVSVDWVALNSDGFPDDAVASARTTEALVNRLIANHAGDRALAEYKLTNGDNFLRQRVRELEEQHEQTLAELEALRGGKDGAK